MALLADHFTSPVGGGWRYLQPETGLWFEKWSLPEIIDSVIEHRIYKGITPIDRAAVSREIEIQICGLLTTEHCRPEPGEDYRPTVDQTRNITTEKAISLSKTVVEGLKIGTLVDPAESHARADTCRACPMNRKIGTCACTPFWALIDTLVPKSRVEPGLNICAACGCTLKAKVLLPIEAVRAGNEGRSINFPGYCWQNHETN